MSRRFRNHGWGSAITWWFWAWISVLSAGCGGGSSSGGSAEVDREPSLASSNVVLRNNAPDVRITGRFDAIDGYLSQSAKVLRSADRSASVAFTLRVSQRGFYEVYAWWPQAFVEGGYAKVGVEHLGGETQTRVDQRSLGGQWNSLGVYEFDPSRSAAVVLEKAGSAPLIVDAIRFQFVGSDRPALTWRTEQLALGLRNSQYSARLAAGGGVFPYSYALTSGSLPPGVELNAGGEVSGRPTRTGLFTFRVSVQDAAGTRAERTLAIEISDSAGSEADAPGAPPGFRTPERERAAAADLSGLLGVVSGMPEGGWVQANLNLYSNVWTPADLRPLLGNSNPTPSKIILAWSSFAWDLNRGNLLLYGGGHANYRGNDVYMWRGSSRKWERASLPSEMLEDSLGNINAIDGADAAPASAHTYDNTMFFPVIDRLVVFGGAADKNGGHYLTQATATTSRKTGIYLFDPSRAHPDKVGGTTGSHVKRVAQHPEIVGGNMWSNRESWLNAGTTGAPSSESFVNGCGGYATEGGKDVAYVRTAYRLYRFSINDVSNPGADSWGIAGRYYVTGSGSKATCSYDFTRKVFVATGKNTSPFVYWNLNTPGATNNEVPFMPTDPSGEFPMLLSSNAITLHNCALEFDPKRRDHVLWCGDGRIWRLRSPSPLSASGWTITKENAPTTVVPASDLGTGIMGKWKYIENLDVFMGLVDSVQGNIWIYKPVGWQSPSGGNVPPSVAISSPPNGASFELGTPVTISADASDTDGAVSKVEFFAGAQKIGEALSAPYSMEWSGAAQGPATLTAVATDDKGLATTSAPVSIVVGSTGQVTVVLRRGASGASDTYLSSYHPGLSFGTAINLLDYGSQYSSLVRFAIFQSEGGPVPNGSQIHSAVLSLYKYSSYDMSYGVHRLLKDWSESAATWNQRAPSISWSAPGANGVDADYAAVADALASTSFSPGWIHFDVTAAVGQMSASTSTVNFGWRLIGISGYTRALKRFYSSEFTSDTSLRPKLVITYE